MQPPWQIRCHLVQSEPRTPGYNHQFDALAQTRKPHSAPWQQWAVGTSSPLGNFPTPRKQVHSPEAPEAPEAYNHQLNGLAQTRKPHNAPWQQWAVGTSSPLGNFPTPRMQVHSPEEALALVARK